MGIRRLYRHAKKVRELIITSLRNWNRAHRRQLITRVSKVTCSTDNDDLRLVGLVNMWDGCFSWWTRSRGEPREEARTKLCGFASHSRRGNFWSRNKSRLIRCVRAPINRSERNIFQKTASLVAYSLGSDRRRSALATSKLRVFKCIRFACTLRNNASRRMGFREAGENIKRLGRFELAAPYFPSTVAATVMPPRSCGRMIRTWAIPDAGWPIKYGIRRGPGAEKSRGMRRMLILNSAWPFSPARSMPAPSVRTYLNQRPPHTRARARARARAQTRRERRESRFLRVCGGAGRATVLVRINTVFSALVCASVWHTYVRCSGTGWLPKPPEGWDIGYLGNQRGDHFILLARRHITRERA